MNANTVPNVSTAQAASRYIRLPFYIQKTENRFSQIHVNKHTGAQRGCISLYGHSRESLIVTLYPLLQRFNAPFQIVVVASVSCQTCVAMHGSIQMPWSIRRPKENVPTKPVLRAPAPTHPVKICHRHVAQDGEPGSYVGAYPVVAVPTLSLDRALRMILIWKWPKGDSGNGRREVVIDLLHSHLPTPVDPHIIRRSHTFSRLLVPMWVMSVPPFLESVYLCDRTLVGMPPSLRPPCRHHPSFQRNKFQSSDSE